MALIETNLLGERRANGKVTTKWATGDDVMAWWTQDRQKDKPLDGQTEIDLR